MGGFPPVSCRIEGCRGGFFGVVTQGDTESDTGGSALFAGVWEKSCRLGLGDTENDTIRCMGGFLGWFFEIF